jgi:hypothetical protein
MGQRPVAGVGEHLLHDGVVAVVFLDLSKGLPGSEPAGLGCRPWRT